MAKQGKGFNFDKAIEAHAQDETTWGADFRDPPPDIKGGVARLTGIKLDQYKSGKNEGETYFRAEGVIVEPRQCARIVKIWDAKARKAVIVSSDTEKTEGLQISIMEPLCDTQKANGDTVTADEHVATMMNHLRRLGGDTSTIESQAELEALMEALVEEKPYFKFSTTGTEPNAERPEQRVFANFNGIKGLEDYSPPADADEIDDKTGGNTTAPKAGKTAAPKTKVPEPEEKSLEDLVLAADEQGDAEAAATLEKMAIDAGVPKKQIDSAGSWQEVADMISEYQGDGGDGVGKDTSTSEEPEPVEPEAGETYMWKAPKGKKKTEHEVVGVNKAKQTANLKDLATNTVHRGVAWSDFVE